MSETEPTMTREEFEIWLLAEIALTSVSPPRRLKEKLDALLAADREKIIQYMGTKIYPKYLGREVMKAARSLR